MPTDQLLVQKLAVLHPLYSPRTKYSNLLTSLTRLTTNLSINFDKYTLGFFKHAFQSNNSSLSLYEFLAVGERYLKDWQKDKQPQQRKILLLQCLLNLFYETSGRSVEEGQPSPITWNDFNNLLIEKGLSLRSLKSKSQQSSITLKHCSFNSQNNSKQTKITSPIQKMIYIPDSNRIAYICEQSNQVNFYSLQSGLQGRALILEDQQLIVNTMKSRFKKQSNHRQNYKKQIIVSKYSNKILDIIYIEDKKYQILITSSTDRMIRGWDLSTLPVLAKQPENQDEKIIHQFSIPINNMAFDSINQVLYCSGNDGRIYQWMIKTDSERQIQESGHNDMISVMLMIPKLQYLATGGFDGKLILWDTIAQSKKFIYQQHTRSINSITFHQQLILLFTAAYDHLVCVWNPYIPSLIHKIVCNTQIIQISILEGTNLIAILDASSILKIKQVNKFTNVGTFTIDGYDNKNKIDPNYFQVGRNKLIFGGMGITVYEYQFKNLLHNKFNLVDIKYNLDCFELYVCYRNCLQIWNLLNGKLNQNILIQEICGYWRSLRYDKLNQGNVVLHKLQTGLVYRLYKHKTKVNYIYGFNVKTNKINYNWILFSVSEDNEVAVYTNSIDENIDSFTLDKTFELRKIAQQPKLITRALTYYIPKNILIITTRINNSSNVFFIDIDKIRIIHLFHYSGNISSLLIYHQTLICLSNHSLFSIHLPPHSYKFTLATQFSLNLLAKAPIYAYDQLNQILYIATHQQLSALYVGTILFAASKIQQKGCKTNQKEFCCQWTINLLQPIHHLLLIEYNSILVASSVNNKINFRSVKDGSIICTLPTHENFDNNNQPDPIMFTKKDCNSYSIYDANEAQLIKVIKGSPQTLSILYNPYYEVDKLQPPLREMKSNKKWKLTFDLESRAATKSSMLKHHLQNLNKYHQSKRLKQMEKNQENFSLGRKNKSLQKVNLLQRKWEEQKVDNYSEFMLQRQTLKKIKYSRNSSNSVLAHNYKAKVNKEGRTGVYAGKELSSGSSSLSRLVKALGVKEGDPQALKFKQMQTIIQRSNRFRLPNVRAKKT